MEKNANKQWYKYTEIIPPENIRLIFRMEYMMYTFECEGTCVHKNGKTYSGECYANEEIREMFYRGKCVEWSYL